MTQDTDIIQLIVEHLFRDLELTPVSPLHELNLSLIGEFSPKTITVNEFRVL